MIVQPVWLLDEPHGTFWDQSLIRDLLASLPYDVTFEDDATADPGTWHPDAAVFLIPARQHAPMDHVNILNHMLARYDGAVIFLTGDEASTFPVAKLTNPAYKYVWYMDGRPERTDPPDFRVLGSGYSPELRANLTSVGVGTLGDVRGDWLFAGQINHTRREEMQAAVAELDGGAFLQSAGFTQGVDPRTYAELMTYAKVVLCPSGRHSPDSFRVYEALEACAVPLVDAVSPAPSTVDYWGRLFPAGSLFPQIVNWSEAEAKIAECVKGWPMNAVHCSSWWGRHKQWMRRQFIADVDSVTGPRMDLSLGEKVTVLVATSPIPSNPDIRIIDETIRSVQERLPGVEIRVMCDGVRPEQERMRDNYEAYLHRVVWASLHQWDDVTVWPMPKWLHQAEMTRRVLQDVTTPVVLFVEHDTPLIGEIPSAELVEAIIRGDAQSIRLHHEASVLEPHRHLMVGEREGDLWRTIQWSQRPHFAATWWYRDVLDTHFPSTDRTMIEDIMHGAVIDAWDTGGMAGWSRFGLWLFHPDGDIKRSTHTDGRQGEPKFEMVHRRMPTRGQT